MDRSSFLKLAAGAGAITFLPKWSATGQALSAGDAPITVTPVKEGSSLRTVNTVNTSLFSNEWVIAIGFRPVVTPDYPLLYRASRNMGSAFSGRVDWTVKDWRGKLRSEHNFTQIFRTPYGITNTEIASLKFEADANEKLVKMRREALALHLMAVEHALMNGRRSEKDSRPSSIRTMGGVKEFRGGTLSLRTLRDLQLLTNRQPNDSDMYQEEFLSEVTLQVTR